VAAAAQTAAAVLQGVLLVMEAKLAAAVAVAALVLRVAVMAAQVVPVKLGL
jgi:hypothetical protein